MTSVPVSSRYRSLYMGDDGRCTFCPPTTMMRRPQASAQWLLLGDGGSPWGDMALVCVWKIEGNPPWHPLLFSKWNCEDKKCVNLSRPLFRLPLRSCTHSLQYLFWFEDKETWEIRRLGALTSYSVPCPRKRRCPKGYILDPAIVFWWSEWATGTKWGRL